MKRVKVFFMASIFLAITLIVPKAYAITYYGEFCWELKWSSSDVIDLKLGISDMGNGHYFANGLFSSSNFSPSTGTTAVYGSGEVIGNLLVMTLNYSSITSTSSGYGTISLIFSPDTLSGSHESFFVRYDKSTSKYNREYNNGSAKNTSCP